MKRLEFALRSVSIYFYAGDFAEALRRFERGDDQTYQTHNEVARLIRELAAEGILVNVYSFITPERKEEEPVEGEVAHGRRPTESSTKRVPVTSRRIR